VETDQQIESGMGTARDYRLAYQFMQRAAEIYAACLRQQPDAMGYLHGRGFTDATIRAFELGYAPHNDDVIRKALCAAPDAPYKVKLACEVSLVHRTDDATYRDFLHDRVTFPIRWPDAKGKFRVVAFGARTLCEGTKCKYLNSRTNFIYKKSVTMYGLDRAYADILNTGEVVLVEGYTDCIAAHQNGIGNVVAAAGTAFTDGCAHVLAMYARTARVVMDPDKAGVNGGKKAVEALRRAGVDASAVVLPGGLDPDEFIGKHGADEFRRLLK